MLQGLTRAFAVEEIVYVPEITDDGQPVYQIHMEEVPAPSDGTNNTG